MRKRFDERGGSLGRPVVTVLLFFFVMFTPWWLYTGLILFFIFYFTPYYEAIFIGFFIDALYGHSMMLGFPALFTLGTVILVAVSGPLRDRLTW